MHLNNIFHDYALVKAPRDLIFGMSTQMTDRNDIRYINLHSLVIKGHKRSQKVTKRSPEVKNEKHPTKTRFFACIHRFL